MQPWVDKLPAAGFLYATPENGRLETAAGERKCFGKYTKAHRMVKAIFWKAQREGTVKNPVHSRGNKKERRKTMILADKIILERKKNGWSQEELAEQLGVSRQAVSKWEGAQAVPDLQRILQMSRLFGVSTDYLMKDEIQAGEDTPEGAAGSMQDAPGARRVGMDEANEFLRIKQKTAPQIAFATLLCILSPIALFLLGVCAEQKMLPLSENAAAGIGMVVLLGIVAGACAIFISCGMKTKPYEFLEKEIIETEYGVTGMVLERKRRYEATYTRYNIAGTLICICGVMLLFVSVIFSEQEFVLVLFLCLMLVAEGVGVCFFILAGITQASFQKLLQEGEYSIREKTKFPLRATVGTVYWLAATAIFLGVGFAGSGWKNSWLVWPIAGVLFPAVLAIVNMFEKK